MSALARSFARSDVTTDWASMMEPVARELLGEPNSALSSPDELRFGKQGAVSVMIAGHKKGSWYSHEESTGGGVVDLVVHMAGTDKAGAIRWLKERGYVADERHAAAKRIVARYPYKDEHGTLLYTVCRFEPKDFRPMLPNGRMGRGEVRVPYQLPELLASEQSKYVFIVEGENDVERLQGLGLLATCNDGGANKWPAEFGRWFKGRHAVVLPDNDEPGRMHAQMVASSLKEVAASVRVVKLEGLPPKGDVSDWLDAGHDDFTLLNLATNARFWTPDEGGSAGMAAPEPITRLHNGALVTEDSLALDFTERHGDELRYVSQWGKWFRWDTTCWAEERTLAVYDLARKICRDAAAELDQKVASRILSASTRSAVENLARSDRRLAATVEQWDADLWLINTPGGTVDLRTGKVRQHDRTDHITKRTAVAPGGGCPTWLQFLDRVTDGNGELISFLKRMAGYSLTGSTQEHALFFLYGTGANGKSVFINTIAQIAADYGATAPMETFTVSNNERHPTDMAMLRGARVVISSETEEGRRWAESKVKALTGGDPISARFMRQDFFTFIPQFKLIVAGNHRPGIRNVDEGMRRRLNLIPFTVTIPPDQRDAMLPEKLKVEWPGILAWMIEGCLEWQRDGLNPPDLVRAATDEYLSGEDAIERWMNDRCVSGPSYASPSKDLWESWRDWAKETGEYEGTQKKLIQAIKDRANGCFVEWRGSRGERGLRGLQTIRQDVGGGWHDR
jgi:putative DNA primase/helicase